LCSQFASLLLPLAPPTRHFLLCAVKDAAWAAAEVGKVRVASLDWADPACYAAFAPPYDFLLAADCVYSELAGERLCWPAGWKLAYSTLQLWCTPGWLATDQARAA
jgi:hypothetical protein